MMRPADPSTTHAIVVGIETYGGIDGTLDGPVPNACSFAAWLVSRGIPPDNIRLHLAPSPANDDADDALPIRRLPATEDAIRATLRELQEVDASFLFVYWSGHGFEINDRLRLLVADNDPRDVRNLDLDALLQALRTNDYRRVESHALLVDACRLVAPPDEHSRFRGGEIPRGAGTRPYRQVVLLGAQPHEPATNIAGTGVFSARLLDELASTPEAPWPPDLQEIAARLRPESPDGGLPALALWRFRGLRDERDEVEILAPEAAPARRAPVLTAERRRQLVELLAQHPGMGTPADRVRVLDRLHRATDVRAVAGDLPDDGPAPEALVEWCARWPDGVMDLVEAVRAADPGADASVSLEVAFPAGSLTYARMEALWPHLLPVNLWGDHLRQLYRNSLPHRLTSDPAATTPAAVVRVLADLTRQDDGFPYPVLEFVERVAFYSGDTATASALRAWVEETGAELALEAGDIEALRRRVTGIEAPAGGAVQLVVRRSVYEPDKLLVRAWYRPDGMAAVTLLEAEIPERGAPEQCFAGLLRALARDDHPCGLGITLEVFLERDMLAHPVHEWLIDTGGRFRVAAGARYPFVVRSLDRSEVRELWDDWTAKWTQLLGRFGEAAGQTLTPLRDEDARDPEALYLRLVEPGVVGASLAFPPHEPVSRDGTALDSLIDAGVPVAVWLGNGGPTVDPRTRLDAFLEGRSMESLRDAVREHRSGARQGVPGCDLGNRISLLWDDPTRPLPSTRLRQPTA